MTLSTFIQCAQAFEIAFITDDFSGLASFYTNDAVHTLTQCGPFGSSKKIGVDEIMEGFRLSVNTVDKRFDVRIPEILQGPEIRNGGIWMRFRLTFRRAGLPDLSVEGEHFQVFKNGKCIELVEHLDPGHGDHADEYLKTNDLHLKPIASPFESSPYQADHNDLISATRRTAVRIYGAAKSNQDIEAALMVCTDDFYLDAVSLPGRATNKQESREMLKTFFNAFPDYRVAINHLAQDGSACWGEVKMSHRGNFATLEPNGGKVKLPFFSAFEFNGQYISGEQFFLDAGHLSVQLNDDKQVILSIIAAQHKQTMAAI